MGFTADSINQDSNMSRAFITKINIVDALTELCKKKPYAKIGVSDIVAQANISRSGFYHHFEDKNSVVKWVSLQCYSRGIDEIGRTLSWFEGHMITTKGMVSHAQLFVSAKSCQDFDGGQPFFIRHRIENLEETIRKYQRKELTDLLKFQIEAVAHVEVFASEKFMNGGYDFSLKEFCDKVVSTVPKELYHALEHPVEEKDKRGMFFME
jgi:AcrR family transcriptional regulator